MTLGVRSGGGVLLGAKVQLQYYSPMEEVAQLLKEAADPVEFMLQVRRPDLLRPDLPRPGDSPP